MHEGTRKVSWEAFEAERKRLDPSEEQTSSRIYGGGQIVSLNALKEGRGVPRRIDFNTGSYVIGRGEEADCQIADVTVSRQHARLEIFYVEGGEPDVTITDLGSSNGTHINRVTISKAKLKAGDILEFGTVPFKVRTATALKLTTALSVVPMPVDRKVASSMTVISSAPKR